MVTPGATRPAPLAQHQVDEFAGAQQVGRASALHVTRGVPSADAGSAESGRAPVALSAAQMRSIARAGAVPAALAKRIAVASPSPAEAGVKTKPGGAKEKGGAKARPSASTAGAAVPSMPSLEPPPRVEVS